MKTRMVQPGSPAGIRLWLLGAVGVLAAVASAYALGWMLEVVQRWAVVTAALATCANP